MFFFICFFLSFVSLTERLVKRWKKQFEHLQLTFKLSTMISHRLQWMEEAISRLLYLFSLAATYHFLLFTPCAKSLKILHVEGSKQWVPGPEVWSCSKIFFVRKTYNFLLLGIDQLSSIDVHITQTKSREYWP